MKRLQFLAGLFGGPLLSFVMSDAKEEAKAQNYWSSPCHSPGTGKTGCLVKPEDLMQSPVTTLPKPANGECPVCGTKAKLRTLPEDFEDPYYIHGCLHCRCLYYIEVE